MLNSRLFVYVMSLGLLLTQLAHSQHIHLPQHPTATEQFAAEQLQYYVREIIGKTYSISTNSHTSGQSLVFEVGQTPANKPLKSQFEKGLTSRGPDSYCVKVDADAVHLIGGSDRGTLYAVYAFLESQGCRWYSPWEMDQIVPKRDALDLQLRESLHVPTFVQRDVGHAVPLGVSLEVFIDWMVKNRLNNNFAARDYHLVKTYPAGSEKRKAWQVRGDHLRWQWICHNFAWFFKDIDNTFDERPEYFSLYNNRRIPVGTQEHRSYGGGNLCTTNLDVIQIAADFASDWFDRHPTGSIVPMWPSDGAIKWCECDNCRALGGENFKSGEQGSMSRRLITFVNAVARKVAMKHPDRLLLLPAYANYVLPVADLPIEKNVMVQYCFHADYAHGPLQSLYNTDAVNEMKQWAAKVPGRFGVWEYFLIGDHRQTNPVPVTLPLIYRVRDTVRFFQSIGTRYYFTQSTSAYHSYNTLLYYALARYLNDPSLDADTLIRDYCKNMFGPASQIMSQYYIDLEKAVADSGWHPLLYADVTTPSPLVWTDEWVQKCQDRLKHALAMVPDLLIIKRLERVQEALNNTVKSVNTQKMAGLDHDVKWRLERGEDAYIINADGRDSDALKQQQVVQNAMDQGEFDPQFSKILFRSRKRRAPVVKIQNEMIQVAVVPEIGGRIVRIKDIKSGWNFLKESPESDTLDQLGTSYFAYGGYEEYVGKAFAGPGWEVPFTCEKQVEGQVQRLILTAKVDDYQLTRTITLADPNKPEVQIQSKLTNLSSTTRKTMLRVHPSFTLGNKPGQYELSMLLKGDQVLKSQLQDHHDGPQVQPDGMWTVRNPNQMRALVHTFNPDQARCYLFVNDEKNYFNLELMGREVDLLPNTSLVLDQNIIAINYMDKVETTNEQQPQATRNQPVKWDVLERKMEQVPGKVKQAASLNAQSRLTYKTHQFATPQGSIAMWVKLPTDLSEAKTQFLFAIGKNNPDWFYTVLDQGKLSVLFKNGRAPFQKQGEFYNSVHARIASWQKDQWHHLVIAWQFRGKEESTLKIYHNGQLLERRDNLTLGMQYLSDDFVVGRSSASHSQPAMFMVDELVVSSQMWSDEQVQKLFMANQDNQVIVPGQQYLLYESFD